MPDIYEPGLTWEEIQQRDWADAKGYRWDEIQGDYLKELNGFQSKRQRKVTRSYTNTQQNVTR